MTDALVLCPKGKDPLAAALALSTTAQPIASSSRGIPTSDNDSFEADDGGLETSQLLPDNPGPPTPWHCQVLISRPPPIAPAAPIKNKEKPKPPPEPEYLIRANTIAGYWELNRRHLRSLTAGQIQAFPLPRVPVDDSKAPIHPSAQISADSIVGEGTKIGERSSIKKSIIGRHCVIGKGAKLSGCILWDFAVIDEK